MLNLDESSMKVIILGKLFTLLSTMGLNSTKPRDFLFFEYFMIEDRFHYTLSKLDIFMNFDEKPVKKL